MTDVEKKLAFIMCTSPSLDTMDGKYEEAAKDLVKNGVTIPVRCKDCKYGSRCGDEIACYHQEYDLEEGVRSHPKDFFCFYGERKEGSE